MTKKNGQNMAMKKMQEKAENIKQWVTDDDDTFWTNVRQTVKITKPIFKMIKFCDQDGPLMGRYMKEWTICLVR